MSRSTSEKALYLLRYFPRVTQHNSIPAPLHPTKKSYKRGQYALGGRGKYENKTPEQLQRFLPPGWVGVKDGWAKPLHGFWFRKTPIFDYYKDVLHRRQYPHFSLYQLQLSIDTGFIDPNEPIDLSTLCNSNHFFIDPLDNQYGVNLLDNGMDVFKTQVNIEVQYAGEQTIAAIERAGGVITTAFYDIKSVMALANPLKFFNKGEPIPKRGLPPPDCIDYYTDPKNRGYLADPDKVAQERFRLAQKYGYTLPDLTKDPNYKMLSLRKDPRQVFLGLEPGWVVNLKDKEILKPVDSAWKEFYSK